MPRRLFLHFSLLAVILTACAPPATSAPAATVSPAPTFLATATNIPHADAIRFALVGDVTLTNVWAYYDERGADYNNRAVQAGMVWRPNTVRFITTP